ncbi:MAG: DNA-methyltransferase [Candidatus Odinarchaeota archaeon]
MLTDPPFSGYVHSNAMRGARDKYNKVFGESKDFGFDSLSLEVAQSAGVLMAKITKAWLLVFSDIESSPLWRECIENGIVEYIRTGAWVKIAPTPQFSGDRPAAGFEAINIFHPRGRKCWNGGGSAAVWSYPAHGGDCDIRYHKAQKPVELITKLIALFSNEGNLILDPFLGSGTTTVCAKKLNRHYIGIEIEEKYCEIAAKRLCQEVFDLR